MLLKMNDLEKYRKIINTIDDKLISLISDRINAARMTMSYKLSEKIDLFDYEREQEVINRIASESNLDKSFVSKIYNEIIKEGKSQFQSELSEKMIIAGPCSIESEEQITRLAKEISLLGIKYLRGGAFKPRTNPKSFQGLGQEGLRMMRIAADEHQMKTVSELVSCSQIDEFYDLIDIIQVGSRNMSNYELLKYLGSVTAEDQKPILLKRGFCSTLKEYLYAAEYILERGNPNVILCLRGIRTFEQKESEMRFTPDLSSILELKELSKLKVLFDPSHSSGASKYVVDLSKAALTLGADGLIIETHYDPSKALTDGPQAILPQQLNEILRYL